ncbi:MAG: NAD+ synthase, partial [Anaerolineae bacterium]
MDTLRLAMAQINTTVGDLQPNHDKIVAGLSRARQAGAQIILFPELAICGYPPEDLLLKPSFINANRQYLDKLLPHSRGLTAVVGFVDAADDIYNAAAVLHNGRLAGVYRKFLLPNYGVFDEERYFKRGASDIIFSLGSISLGISVCEDIWYPAGPPEHQAANGAQLLLNISASPYQEGKIQDRERMLVTRAADNVAIVAYCNLVGGQDELIFDGSSVIINERGSIIARAKSFAEDFVVADVDLRGVLRQRLRDPRRRKDRLTFNLPYKSMQTIPLDPLPAPSPPSPVQAAIAPLPSLNQEIYTALVVGTRDYIHKNGFSKAVIGLSGGIDSSLVACIAVDALGNQNVVGVSMPSRYSSDHSKDDARQLAENLNIRYHVIPVEAIFQSYLDTLAGQFKDTAPNETEENLQSRARGNILMALSNKFGWLVLTTGNK